jgi:hypothetical protein
MPASVARRHAPLPVSPCWPGTGNGQKSLHIRDGHRSVMKTVEDSISLVENGFNSQEGPLRQ